MRGHDFRIARQKLGASYEEVANYVDMAPSRIRDLEGPLDLPRQVAHRLRFALRQIAADRIRAEYKLKECHRRPVRLGGGLLQWFGELAHLSRCQTCRRERDLVSRFLVMNAGAALSRAVERGVVTTFRFLRWLGRASVPVWAGAFFLGGLTLLRIVFFIPALLRSDVRLIELLQAVAVAAAAGGFAGLVFALGAPLAKGGWAGRYLRWMLAGSAYMMAMIFVLQSALGGADMADFARNRWVVIVALGMGAVLGIAACYGWERYNVDVDAAHVR